MKYAQPSVQALGRARGVDLATILRAARLLALTTSTRYGIRVATVVDQDRHLLGEVI